MLVVHGVDGDGALFSVEVGQLRPTSEPVPCRVCGNIAYGEDHLGGAHACCLRWGPDCLACAASAAFRQQQGSAASRRLMADVAARDDRDVDPKVREAAAAAASLAVIRKAIGSMPTPPAMRPAASEGML